MSEEAETSVARMLDVAGCRIGDHDNVGANGASIDSAAVSLVLN